MTAAEARSLLTDAFVRMWPLLPEPKREHVWAQLSDAKREALRIVFERQPELLPEPAPAPEVQLGVEGPAVCIEDVWAARQKPAEHAKPAEPVPAEPEGDCAPPASLVQARGAAKPPRRTRIVQWAAVWDWLRLVGGLLVIVWGLGMAVSYCWG